MVRIARFIEKYENAPLSFRGWLGTALLIAFLRDGAAFFSAAGIFASPDAYHLVRAPLFHLSLLLFFILLVHWFSGAEITRVSKILLVPFFAAGIPVPAGPFPFEAGVLALAALGYIALKTKKVIVSLAGALAVAGLGLAYAHLPSVLIAGVKGLVFIIGALHLKNFPLPEGILGENTIILLTLFLVSLEALLGLACFDRAACRAVLKNMRPTRSAHYVLLCLFGVFISGLWAPVKNFFEVIRIAGMASAVFFAFQFSVVINDLFDADGDRISNADRPLVTRALDKDMYLNIGGVFLTLGLLFAYGVSDTCVMIILLFTAFYFLYSAPPLRLKRFFPLGAGIIGLEALLAFLTGIMSREKGDALALIHPSLFWLVFIVFFLGGNIKDLKDIEGDRRTGVATLPVLLGEEKGRLALAFLVFASYVLVPGFLHFSFPAAPVLVLSLAFGVGSFFYIRSKNSKEQAVFAAYFAYLCCLMLLIR